MDVINHSFPVTRMSSRLNDGINSSSSVVNCWRSRNKNRQETSASKKVLLPRGMCR
uniref:Uncharacterized protein n=1 Tax=Pfiesteria piscicida TaxID=71001 RepID=E8Z6G3_PFIPI|nr:unknown [Pfiesteria piscicida]